MTLLESIQSGRARVGIIGLGYVGLPLARAFWEAGFDVLGFDTDESKLARLARGESYLAHLGEAFVSDMAASGRFAATGDHERLAEPDALLVCVPTPLDAEKQPDLSHVVATTEHIAATLRHGQLVVLESTSWPGTTREVVLPILARSGLACGRDFFLAFSPERVDPGRADPPMREVPKLVGGVDPASAEVACALYGRVVREVVPVSRAEVAEAAKLLENLYRAVNIALVNELKTLLEARGIDVWEVVEAAATKPYGFQSFRPGPGWGGHCIPIDPYYLSWMARAAGKEARFVELAGEINRSMPGYVLERVRRALAEDGKQLAGASVLVLGLAYKPDVDDVRESPAFELLELLRAAGAAVAYNDPHVPRTPRMRHYDLELESTPLTADSLAGADCVVVVTDHSAYDWEAVAHSAALIVDTRGALRSVAAPRARIVTA